MVLKDWLIGTLSPDGYLKTESGKILLTTLPKGASQPPEAATLPVAEEYLSKTALVRGCLVGNVLYSAQAVETLPRLSGALIQKLAEKGVVSLTQIQEQLSELESEDQETAPPKKLCAWSLVIRKALLVRSTKGRALVSSISTKIWPSASKRRYRKPKSSEFIVGPGRNFPPISTS
jgi:hypothetical protein